MDWENNWVIFLLIGGHAFLYTVAFFLTFRPRLSLFHVLLATQFVTFVIRPLLAAKESFFLYQLPDGWRLYNLGLLLQLKAALLFVGGYLVGRLSTKRRFSPDLREPFFRATPIFFRGMLFSLSTGVLSVVLIHILSGGLWLPSARSQALTAVVPFGKALFGTAVIPLSVSLALSLYLLWGWRRISVVHKAIYLVSLLLSGVLLVLLYQRGFLIMAVIVFAFLLDRVRAITYGRLALFAGIAMITLIFTRPLAVLVATGEMPEIERGLKSYLLYKPNFDTSDVWPVVLAYVDENGFLNGKTLLAIPLRIASPYVRLEWNLYTAVDVLNAYYQGPSYWETRFGFNVSFPQEIFLNFGWMGLCFTFLTGFATALVDAWLWHLYPRRVFFIYAVFCSVFHGRFYGGTGRHFAMGLGLSVSRLGCGLFLPDESSRARNFPL